ncbi:MAG: CheR family methyltransferase, partial [Sediminispirochaetaceae bacterium]
DAEFESISKLVYEKFGINLTEKKRMLVRGRLHKRLLQMGHENFQIILCRNVMIYFDEATKNTLITKFAQVLQDNGYLFIGHSETLGRDHPQFQYVKPAIYQKQLHT